MYYYLLYGCHGLKIKRASDNCYYANQHNKLFTFTFT